MVEVIVIDWVVIVLSYHNLPILFPSDNGIIMKELINTRYGYPKAIKLDIKWAYGLWWPAEVSQ